ncbi:AzlD family protein [Halosimplex sp. J119]
MSDAFALDPTVVGVVLAMAFATYLTKASGLWLITHVGISERAEAALEVLPGAIVVAVIGPELAAGGPPEWLAGGVVAIVAWRTENIFLALVAGVGAVVAFRTVL